MYVTANCYEYSASGGVYTPFAMYLSDHTRSLPILPYISLEVLRGDFSPSRFTATHIPPRAYAVPKRIT